MLLFCCTFVSVNPGRLLNGKTKKDNCDVIKELLADDVPVDGVVEDDDVGRVHGQADALAEEIGKVDQANQKPIGMSLNLKSSIKDQQVTF